MEESAKKRGKVAPSKNPKVVEDDDEFNEDYLDDETKDHYDSLKFD